jgi:triacylglycerol esterase/lipase EstA (alpha/beta hydrolase family)
LAGFIDKLAGKPILIGHSMGGLDKWVSEFVEALKIVELES